MNLPLGFAIIVWKSGGHSKAIISNDSNGTRMFHCANWINTDLTPVEKYYDQMEEVITDIDDILAFYGYDAF
ncbi:hypothetical protein [Providencia phage PSTRCR_121]|nr:hypothetical protein [Providencia phage PSTRCR_121]